MAVRLLAIWSFSVFATTILAAGNGSCYYPAGVQNRGSPCNPNAAESSCCGPGFVCLSNGLCQPGKDDRQTYHYDYYRSGCTDPTFKDPACPQFCLGSGDSLDAGEGLQSCDTGRYCCKQDYNCCTNSTLVFPLGIGNVVTTIPYASSTSTSPSTSSSTLASGSSSTTSASHSAASASTSPAAQPAGGKDSSNKVAIGVGVGIGVAVFLALITGILLFLRQRQNRRKRSAVEAAHGPAHEMNSGRSESKTQLSSPKESHTDFDSSVHARSPTPDEIQLHEMGYEPRYELGTNRLSSKLKEPSIKDGSGPEFPGRYFKEDGVFRHEAP